MKRSLFAVLAVSLLFVVGCSKNPHVGAWTVQVDPQIEQMARQMNQPLPTGELLFTKDEKFTWSMNAPGMNIKIEGTYKEDGKTLTLAGVPVKFVKKE